MWEWLKDSAGSVWDWGKEAGGNIFEYGKELVSKENLADTLKGAGALASAFAQYQANEQNKDLLDYKKAEALAERKRRDQAQAELDQAVASVWG